MALDDRWIDKAKREFSIRPPAEQQESALGLRMLDKGSADININAELARHVIAMECSKLKIVKNISELCVLFEHTINGLPRDQAIEAEKAGIHNLMEKWKKKGVFDNA